MSNLYINQETIIKITTTMVVVTSLINQNNNLDNLSNNNLVNHSNNSLVDNQKRL